MISQSLSIGFLVPVERDSNELYKIKWKQFENLLSHLYTILDYERRCLKLKEKTFRPMSL